MKRPIVWLAAASVIVLAVLGGGVWRALAARQAQQQVLLAAVQRAPAPLQLAADEWLPLQKRSLPLSVAVSGALRAVDSAMLKARAGGELLRLSVREGDGVKAGQEVAWLDPSEAQARLRQAQRQADAARAQVEIGERQYGNNQALVAQGFISATALLASQTSLDAARSNHQAALAAVDLVRKALDDTVLRSPISGLVAQRFAQPGERVGPDARIVEIVDISLLELEAQLAPADALALRVGQPAWLDVEGLAEPMRASVARIGPSALAGNRALPVYLRLHPERSAALLRQGLFAQGLVDTGRVDALALPLDAVRSDKPRPYVQTIADGRVAHAPVTTGARARVDGQTLVAVEGLAEGAPVILGRIGPLREGLAVSTAPAAAASARH